MHQCILIVLVVFSKWPSVASEFRLQETVRTNESDKKEVELFIVNNITIDNESVNALEALKVCFYQAMDDIITRNGTNRTCGEQFDKIFEQYKDPKYNGIKIRVKLLQHVLHHKYTQAFINNESCMNESNCIKLQFIKTVNLHGHSAIKYDEKKLLEGPKISDMFFNFTYKEKYNAWTCDKIRVLRKCIELQELGKCDYHAGKFYEAVLDYVVDYCGNYTTIQYKQLDDNASRPAFIWYVLGGVIIAICILFVCRTLFIRRYKRCGVSRMTMSEVAR